MTSCAHFLKYRQGFVLPAVLFTLVIISAIALGALLTSSDERDTASGFRASGRAMYAAEAGLNEVLGTWDDSLVNGLAPGDSVVLGPNNLLDGSSYTLRIHRRDNGGQKLYAMTVDATAPQSLGGGAIDLIVTGGSGGGLFTLGACCDAAATVRGSVEQNDALDLIDGTDNHPPTWVAAGVCLMDKLDKPGLIIDDSTQVVQNDPAATITGDPDMVEDTTMTNATFDDYGGLTYLDLVSMATIIIDGTGSQVNLNLAPAYNGDGTCNTSVPTNWGSSDPGNACFNYFPVILVRGEVEGQSGYGQGIVVLDLVSPTVGSEFNLEGANFGGLIVGMGCVDIEYGTLVMGAVFVDASYANNNICGSDLPLHMKKDGQLRYSSCAIQRALAGSGIGLAAGGGGGGGIERIVWRSFAEFVR